MENLIYIAMQAITLIAWSYLLLMIARRKVFIYKSELILIYLLLIYKIIGTILILFFKYWEFMKLDSFITDLYMVVLIIFFLNKRKKIW